MYHAKGFVEKMWTLTAKMSRIVLHCKLVKIHHNSK